VVPLSEHEQRILAELEESLSKADPRFARNVRETTVYTHSGRRVRWGVLGFLAGLAMLVATFSTSILLGLIGVAIMFASLLVINRNVWRLGRAGWQDLTRSLRPDGDRRAAIDERRHALREWLDRRRRGE
jgi:hypothetical protein